MIQRRTNESGFTMIELLVAMAVFSFMLLIVAVGFISIVRIQQSGIASRATQQNARNTLDQIVRDVRTASIVQVGSSAGRNWLCMASGSQFIEYAMDAAYTPGGTPDLRMSSVTDCTSLTGVTGWQKVNDDNVFVPVFVATSTAAQSGSLGTATVTIAVASRDDAADVQVSGAVASCKPGPLTQFCATTSLTTSAALRGTGTGQ